MITIDQARALYSQSDTVHDFDHVLRVLASTERIGPAEDARMEIVRAATMLHDIGRSQADAQGIDHAAYAARQAANILADQPVSMVEAVIHAIAAHRFRSQPSPQTVEARVLFDADKLDAIGAIGVARAYAYGGAHGQRLWAPPEDVELDRWLREGDDPDSHTPVHEFIVKLSRIKDMLYTETGRAVAQERHTFMLTYVEQLNAEVRGAR